MASMTPRQAAKLIGCSPQQVRTLCRKGTIEAETRLSPDNQPYYHITPEAVREYLKQPKGWKRGKTKSK